MSDWPEDQDPYEILGLAQGHESTEAQIKKVCSGTVCKLLAKLTCNNSPQLFRVLTGLQTAGPEEAS